MNVKTLQIEALRRGRFDSARRVKELVGEIRDDLREFRYHNLTPQLAEQVRLTVRDKLGQMVVQGRIYDGMVTNCAVDHERRALELSVSVVPMQSIERIVVNYVIS